MTSEPVGRRESKKATTRLQLMRAAVELFNEQGYDETTVEQIAERAGSSPRTFYRYFPAKDDVAFGEGPDRIEQFRQALALQRRTGDPLKVVREALMEQLIGFGTYEDPDLEAACVELWSQPQLRGRWGDITAQWEQAAAEFLALEWDLDIRHPDCQVNAMLCIAVLRTALTTAAGDRDHARHIAQQGLGQLANTLGAMQLAPPSRE